MLILGNSRGHVLNIRGYIFRVLKTLPGRRVTE